MIYVFHENQLIYQGDKPPDSYPMESYIYVSHYKQWYVKYERNYLHPIKDKHLPKELKVMCLIYGIPLK